MQCHNKQLIWPSLSFSLLHRPLSLSISLSLPLFLSIYPSPATSPSYISLSLHPFLPAFLLAFSSPSILMSKVQPSLQILIFSNTTNNIWRRELHLIFPFLLYSFVVWWYLFKRIPANGCWISELLLYCFLF